MAWLKKEKDVEVTQELEYENNSISETNAYEAEILEAYLKDSADENSKSVSLVVKAQTEDGETVQTYFTILGRDGKSYFTKTHGNTTKKMQHFGLSIADTLFGIALNTSIFEVDTDDITYEQYNKETKQRDTIKGQGFPELVGKKVGVAVQMMREIDGADSKEYPTIEHFFDTDTGLFYNEEAVEGKATKLDKWTKSCKEYKDIVKEVKKSSFGNKAETATDSKENTNARASRWGKK